LGMGASLDCRMIVLRASAKLKRHVDRAAKTKAPPVHGAWFEECNVWKTFKEHQEYDPPYRAARHMSARTMV